MRNVARDRDHLVNPFSFGAIIDEAIKVDVPGMEIGTQHKYAFNVLVDVKPDEVSMTPKGAAVMKQRVAALDPADVCRLVPGFPLASTSGTSTWR